MKMRNMCEHEWKRHEKNLKERILGKKIIDLGYTHFAMYLKLDDGTIVICGSSSGQGVINIGDENTELDV